ncbi:hypothetical protein KIN20_001372 [Parelaphostrongylus tenuis]|uniref:Uncharacterized protein n=1 Tax=Parelaphostrongylus tenuis TaxID=148309 RepID=A0AAD5QG69_PARTN|nr:hypothetical protein KIN20_001372 [Parelaphostrongylus tenuis]
MIGALSSSITTYMMHKKTKTNAFSQTGHNDQQQTSHTLPEETPTRLGQGHLAFKLAGPQLNGLNPCGP